MTWVRRYLAGIFYGILGLQIPLVAAHWEVSKQAIMGTQVRAEVWHEDRTMARSGVDAVMREMHRIDLLMSPYKPASELSKLNADAAQRPFKPSHELFQLIERALSFSETTHGAFDITYASVGHLYDFRNQIKPDEGLIEKVLPAVNYRHVVLDKNKRTVRFNQNGVKIDLGGIAKGHAIDQALAILREQGIRHALVSAGGDTGILGDRLGRPWMVAIRDPRNRNAVVAMLPLQDEALSTSGDYERYFEQDDVRYHHILNPSTGKSAREVRSVSIIGPDATTTDALSTSVFVLGVSAGLGLIDTLPDVEAVIVDQAGALFYSRGLENVR